MDLPRALLLDLDDTILDAYGNPDEVWRRLCSTCMGRERRVCRNCVSTPDLPRWRFTNLEPEAGIDHA